MSSRLSTRLRWAQQALPPEERPDVACRVKNAGNKKATLTAAAAFSMIPDDYLTEVEILPGRDCRLAQILCQLVNPKHEIKYYK